MARTVRTLSWWMAGLLPLVTAAAHAGDLWATPGGPATHGFAGADLPYTLVNLPDVRLHAAGVSIGRFDRVELLVSPQALAGLEAAGVPGRPGYPGGVEVRLSAAAPPGLAMRGHARPDQPGRAFEGDAYDVFLTFFMHRLTAAESPAPTPGGIVVPAGQPAGLARLAGL